MQSRHLCSLHVWHPEPTSIDIRRKKKTIFRDLVPPFHDFFPPSAPPGSMAPWIRSEEIGRNVRRKNEPVSVASRLGTRRSRGVEGRRRGFDAFFFLLLSISLSLSLYLYISIFSCEREPSYWRDGESLLDIEWQFSLGKKRIVECWNETIFPGKSYLETRLSPDLFIFHPPPLSKIYLLALP